MNSLASGLGAPGGALAAAASHYVIDRGWEIVPGAFRITSAHVVRCSCGIADCAEPGGHPAREDWPSLATTNLVRVRRWWADAPDASIVAPTGRAFDVLEVSESAGCLALARLARTGVELGPVASTPSRHLQFFVQPGAAEKLTDTLRAVGWHSRPGQLRCHGPGGFVMLPPSPYGPLGSAARWIQPPTEANRWLPAATSLVGTLAYACRG